MIVIAVGKVYFFETVKTPNTLMIYISIPRFLMSHQPNTSYKLHNKLKIDYPRPLLNWCYCVVSAIRPTFKFTKRIVGPFCFLISCNRVTYIILLDYLTSKC